MNLYLTQAQDSRDSLDEFIRERCVVDVAAKEQGQALYDAYLDWYDEKAKAGQIETYDRSLYGIEFDLPVWDRMTISMFGRVMGEKFPKRRTMYGVTYHGLRLA